MLMMRFGRSGSAGVFVVPRIPSSTAMSLEMEVIGGGAGAGAVVEGVGEGLWVRKAEQQFSTPVGAWESLYAA